MKHQLTILQLLGPGSPQRIPISFQTIHEDLAQGHPETELSSLGESPPELFVYESVSDKDLQCLQSLKTHAQSWAESRHLY